MTNRGLNLFATPPTCWKTHRDVAGGLLEVFALSNALGVIAEEAHDGPQTVLHA